MASRKATIVSLTGLAALIAAASVAAVMRRDPDPVVRTISVARGMGPPVDGQAGRLFVPVWTDNGGNSTASEYVAMLDGTSGDVLRRIPMPGAPSLLTVDARTKRVFVATSNVSINGPSVRILTIDGHSGVVLHDAAVAIPNGVAYSFYLAAMAVDVRSGRLIVTQPGETTCSSPGACATIGSEVDILDARTGRLVHTIPLTQPSGDVAVDEGTGTSLVIAGIPAAWWSSATTSSTSRPHSVITLFDSTGGQVLHRVTVGGVLWRQPVVDETTGRAFLLLDNTYSSPQLPSTNTTLVTLDMHSGRLLRAISLRSVAGGMALDKTQGRLLISMTGPAHVATFKENGGAVARLVPLGNGTLDIFNARTGQLLRRVPVGPYPVAVTVDARARRVLVSNIGRRDSTGHYTQPGTVSILDSGTYAPLRTATVGVSPAFVEVDEGSGRAFVFNVGSDNVSTTPPDPWSWLPGGVRHLLPFLAPPRPRTIPASISVLDPTR